MIDYKRGFTVSTKHPIETIEWLYSEENSDENKLVFLSYDANLYPCSNFSTWNNYEGYKDRQIKKALEFTKDFNGEVWLDDVCIKGARI